MGHLLGSQWVFSNKITVEMENHQVSTPQTRFSTVEEVAKMMRVSKMSVYRLVQAQEITGYRIGRQIRIPTRSVWAYLEGVKIDDLGYAPELRAVDEAAS